MNSNFAPWQAKGRWYRVVIKGGNGYSIESDDGLGATVTTNLFTPANFLALDFKLGNVVFSTAPNANVSQPFMRVNSQLTFYLNLPSSNTIDTLEVWIFGYFNETMVQAESEG